MFRKGGKKEKVKREHNPLPPPFCFVSFHHFPFTTQRVLESSLSVIIRGGFFSLCVSPLRHVPADGSPCASKCHLVNSSFKQIFGVERLHVPICKGRPKLYLPGYKGDETLDALQTLSCDERQIKKHLSLFRSGEPDTPYPAEMLEGGFFLRGIIGWLQIHQTGDAGKRIILFHYSGKEPKSEA